MAQALEHLRILDLTALWPGPLATVMLADLGADVLRLEAPDRPDLLQFLEPMDAGDAGAAWRMVNRNKRSLALNLKAPGAAAIVAQLVQTYDIVIEQFRPGVLQRLGIDYEELRKDQPRLIWCALTGYGQDGPYRDRAGHDLDFVALSGLASRMSAGPSHPGALIGDAAGGSFPAIISILAAVIQRDRTGLGQFIDVAMADGALWLNAWPAAEALTTGAALPAGAHALEGGSLYGYYRCKDGGYLAMAALEPKFWQQFCAAIELPDLVDADTTTPEKTSQVRELIANRLAQEDRATWQGRLGAVDCCVESVLTTEQALAHPHYQARGAVVDVPLAGGGHVRQLGSPLRLSASEPRYWRAGVEAGTDSRAVLAELGLSAEKIEQLCADGVVYAPQGCPE